MTVGEQATAWASARDDRWCGVYSSEDRPEAFTYHSTDPVVASIDDKGQVRALTPGRAELTTTAESFTSSPLELMVSPPFAMLRAEARASALRLGDTVFVTVRSYDSAGREVAGVWTWMRNDDITISPHLDIQPLAIHRALRLPTPATYWFVPQYPGVFSFAASAPTGTGLRRLSAVSVRVTVSPP